MSKESSHIDFDKTLRDKLAGVETPITDENWNRIEEDLHQKDNEAFDTILKSRFESEAISPNIKIPSIPIQAANKPGNNIKWRLFFLLLFLATIPISYAYFEKSNNNNKKLGIENNTKTIKETELTDLKKESTGYPNSKQKNKTTSVSTESTSAIVKRQTPKQTTKQVNINRTSEQSTQEKTLKSPSLTIAKRVPQLSKKSLVNTSKLHKNTATSNANPNPKKTNNNKDIEVNNLNLNSNQTRNNITPKKTNAPKSVGAKNKAIRKDNLVNEKKSVQKSNLKTKNISQIPKTQLANSNVNNNNSRIEKKDSKKVTIPKLTKQEKRKAKKVQHAKNKIEKNSKPKKKQEKSVASTTSQKNTKPESPYIDSNQKIKRFRLSLGAFAQRPFTKLSSSNPKLQTLYQNGENKKWTVNAELQAEYRINKKWSIGSGISMSSYSTSIGKNNFEREELSQLGMDTTNNMIVIQTSMGQAQANNLKDFEFGQIIRNNMPPFVRDTFNSFTYNESLSFKFIQIPLFFQYNGGKGKLRYSIAAGPLLSLVSNPSSNLEIYNTSFSNNKITITDYHKTNNLLWGATSRLGIHYNMSRSFGIHLSPTFNYIFSDLSKIDLFNISTHNLRIPLGISYKF